MTTMVNPTWNQQSAQGFGDGTESGSTQKAAADTGWSQNVDETFHMRHLVQETAGANQNNDLAVQVQAQNVTQATGWFNVTTSTSHVKAVDATSLTEGQDTTQRIGAGTFKGTNGWVTEDGLTGVCTGFSSEECESLIAVQIVGADVNNGDTIQFRVIQGDGATLLTSYAGASIFDITVVKAAASYDHTTDVGVMTLLGVGR